MSAPDYLARVRDRVDLTRIGELRIVIFGLGTVGSSITVELAGSGIQRFRLVDGDVLEPENIVRHAAGYAHVGHNKAEAMADVLATRYPPGSTDVQYYPCFVDGAMADNFLDELIEDADLVVAATDDRRAQRRIAERALAADVPAIFPALYPDGGGEVFVSLGPAAPCLLCWEAFRPIEESLRAVTALNVEVSSVAALAVQLALGVLDPASSFAQLFAGTPTDREPRTLFVLRPHSNLQYVRVSRRDNCPICQVGDGSSGDQRLTPAQRAQLLVQDPERFARDNQGPTVAALWTLAILLIALVTGSPVAVFMFTVTVVGLVLFAFRPRPHEIISRARASGGLGIAAGIIALWLFIAAIVTGNAVVILFLGAALAGAAYLLLRG